MIVINFMTLASFVRFKRLQQWAHDLFSYSNVHCFLFSWFKCSNKIMLMIYLINYLTSFIRWGDWLKLEGAHDCHRLHDEPGEETGVISSYWDLWMICLRKIYRCLPLWTRTRYSPKTPWLIWNRSTWVSETTLSARSSSSQILQTGSELETVHTITTSLCFLKAGAWLNCSAFLAQGLHLCGAKFVVAYMQVPAGPPYDQQGLCPSCGDHS